MRILHLSDTHRQHIGLDLPPADIIVHSGDYTFAGSEEEAYDFIDWFSSLPYKYKIFISGNHDMCMYGANIEGLPDDVHYLCNSGVEIEGLKFWGVPLFMEDCTTGKQDNFYKMILENTDILITHQPPYGICDVADYGSGPKSHGDRTLLERVGQLHLKYHLFGHEHDAFGVTKRGGTVFSNASVLDSKYIMVGKPRLFEL